MAPGHGPGRRQVLRGGAGIGVLTAAALFGDTAPATAATPDTGSAPSFRGVPLARADTVTVPPGYTARVLLPWGAPLHRDTPRWRPDASDTAAEAARQVGTGHGGLRYVPLHPGHDGGRRGLLVLNHSWADPVLLHADGGRAATAARTDKEMASLGMTVVRVELTNGRWRVLDDELNRRLTAASPTRLSGPLAGHGDLETGAGPAGVIGGSAHATTPWGTCLTGEDTLGDVFGTEVAGWTATETQRRYGLTGDGGVYGWHTHRERFDLARNPNEAHRFGWTVEVDPFDPSSAPAKRTALGRLAHGGAAVTESRGRAVVYMSDRTHIYKFVGARPWREARGRGPGPLDRGTLYAARLSSDGLGDWLPLVHGRSGLTRRDGFADQAEVLLRAREAADAVGATGFRRPGTPAVHPETGVVYCPEAAGSGGGRVLSWTEGARDHGAALFSWDEFVRAGAASDDGRGAVFAAPVGLHCGGDGRLWIRTDVTRPGEADEGARVPPANSALLCADPESGQVRRFLTGPRGCGIGGTASSPDQRTLFVTVQGPGSAAARVGAPTVDDPRAVSNWPGFDPAGRPRSAVVVIRKDDGGIIGT
ncbi:transcriptional initiation protein Tat [Nocardiopsis terrae]|uniref:Secreted PhoX family phosphatase n=1 Tax=Nocardiopsis terrae TaxID=372655 RepID=A0ABR9HI94_9ACTN|nr:alkaline phosphatase PhoX [Nocardiopsis terrae]MBE1458744.1 secreted PhoX family phosphatase [Nocardiopsis terrae]GHC78724.1 transcriptional initiation protein Tat [Nocardiopsis terrae]